MFLPEHEIWKFANAAGELDDWLPYAETLVREWSSQSAHELKFGTTFEITIAALLLLDDLLPSAARSEFSKVMIATIDEASQKRLNLVSLHISPPKSGRKRNPTTLFIRVREVRELIQADMTVMEAYRIIAEKHFVSPDTVRREYERVVKKSM